MRRIGLLMLLLIVGCTSSRSGHRHSSRLEREAPIAEVKPRSIEEAITKGVEYLVKSQNADGSWGTGLQTTGFEIYSMVPGSHDAFRVGTTALCVMALRETGETAAHRKGVEYLIRNGQARRDDGDKMYNIWAHLYTVQALSVELAAGYDSASGQVALREAIAWHVERLGRYEVYNGGWNYYDFRIGTQRPAMEATSFSTAAALVALWEARRAGVEVPQGMVDRAVRRLGEMRQPTGAYLYGYDYKYAPRAPYNLPRGSVGRSQAGNIALALWDHPKVGDAQLMEGLALLRDEGMYLNMGRKRPYPHDSWYQNAPYYYYFGYYYAARVVNRLGENAKAFRPVVVEGVLSYQEEDGSWFDYIMWDYHKPYGTAFALMTLLRCR